MNTDTPTTDQWEAYCDEWYYHMWRLRRKNERGWHDGFHIHTGEEAKGLCDLLNNLERERDEARGQLAGIEEKMRVELGGHPDSELWGEAGLIAATMRCVDALGEVTDQRDELVKVIKAASVLIAAKGRHNTFFAYNGLREALKSLTTNELSNQ